MTIVLVGGGSGGHITPVLAVASELKRLQPDVHTVYIGQRGDGLSDIPASHGAIDEVYAIRAGKWRRYHGAGLRQLLDIPTVLKNLRDALYVLMGLWQARRLLKRLAPEIVFIKGGFVGVPVGLAAASLHIPFITHDSDAVPGLANRLIARWAKLHAVALPKEIYAYPPDKTVTVGVPVASDYCRVSTELQTEYKQQIGIPADSWLMFVIGGGLGAQRVNLAVAEAAGHLLKQFPKLHIVHGVGRKHEQDMRRLYTTSLSAAEQGRVAVQGYISDSYRYSGAADVIITRAGATQMAELAVQGRACIVVPNPLLTGGHQLQNARYLEQKQAVVVVSETELEQNPNVLAARVSALLKDPAEAGRLAQQLAAFGAPHAAQQLARLLIDTISRPGSVSRP